MSGFRFQVSGLCSIVIGCAVLAAGADEKAAHGGRVTLDGVAAHVNEHIITIGEVAELVEPVNRQLQNSYTGKELENKLRAAFDDALESIIARYLILDAYEKQEGRIPEW